MVHYDFHKEFRTIYDKAVRLYGSGGRNAEEFFTKLETTFLASIGCTAQEMFDYAEDAHNYGEPDFDTALMIQLVRRGYLVLVQEGNASKVVLDEASLPAKTDEVNGIAWLPRLMPKARAKLRGELPKSLMYGCGGDRRFFKEHDIHPAEFLQVIWQAGDNDKPVVEFVAARKKF